VTPVEENLLLSVEGLKTYFYLREGVLKAVDDVDFTIARGETIGLVGESGSGKSITARSILRMVPSPGKSTGVVIRTFRGGKISMIFQEPMSSLSPVHTIGFQIMEALILHREMNRKEARAETLSLLEAVGLANPTMRIDEYPHQFSGGMRQRIMIAIAISCRPRLLIADEPTTALDVSIQAQILVLLKSLQSKFGMSMLYITHDMGVVAQMVDRVAIMYLGQIMEEARVDDIFHQPLHPYTIKLLESIPDLKKKEERLQTIAGAVPQPINLPPGCVFFRRCPEAEKGVCDAAVPPLAEVEAGHRVRCIHRQRDRRGDVT
jgi:peptide/nickel transport system ATP-binding protein